MSLTKDGFYKSFSGAIGNNNYLLEAGGGHIGWGNAANQIPYSNGILNTSLNADMTDGLHVHTGRNNEANKIVRTDGNGYIQTGYINTNVGTEDSLSWSRVFFEYNNDGYIRKASISRAKSVFFGGQVGSPSVPIYWTGSAFATCIVSFGNQSYGEHDANNINDNGIKYYTSNGPSTSLGATTNDGALYSQAYSTSWVAQIAQDYRNGGLYVRGKNNGTWQSWYRVWDNRTTYVSGGKGYIGGTEITQVNNADTVDSMHANEFVPKRHSARFYPFVNSSYGQPWYKITLPWAGYTSGSNAWMMTTMEIVLGGSYSSGNNGRIYLQYYFVKNTSNVWTASDVRGTCIGYRLIENGVTIKYDIANPGIFYIKANANTYNSIGLENITANDTAPNFDFRNTTIEAIAESSVPSAVNQTVPLYHTITTQNGYWANLNIQTTPLTNTIPQLGGLYVINDSSNNGYDGLGYFRAYTSNDWGLIVDKSNSYTYGVDIRSGGAYALRVGNGNTRLIGSTVIGADDAPSYTLDVRGTTRSTGRIYANEWIQFDSYTGIYSPNNSAHFYPNNSTSYGQWLMQGARGGYSGIQFGTNTGYMTIMDNQDDKGLYEQDWNWILYFNRRNKNLSLRSSSSLGYDISLYGSTALANQLFTSKPAQSWIGGMTNAAIVFGYGQNIDASSYWPFWSMKDSSGNVVNWGGLGNMLGFHGYYAGRTENDCDWRWRVNASNGYWEMLRAYGVWHPSYQSIDYFLTSNGDARHWSWLDNHYYRQYNTDNINPNYGNSSLFNGYGTGMSTQHGIETGGWYHIWSSGWSDNANWISQIAIPTVDYWVSASAWYRTIQGSNYAWRRILDQRNYRASYGTTGGTSYIQIKINSTTSWMLSFKVRVYQSYQHYDLVFSGYNYGGNYWYSPQVRMSSGTAGSVTCYFGYDSAWNLWVGFPGASYTGVEIVECVNGYSQTGKVPGDLFTISNVSSFSGTTQVTTTAYAPWSMQNRPYWANVQVSDTSSTSTWPTFGSAYSYDWWRSYNATGWYNQSYGGGIWMQDSSWIRTYGSKHFYVEGGNFAVSGSAGIGTTSPSYKLHVEGNTYITDYVGIGTNPDSSLGRLRFPYNQIAINFREESYRTSIQYMTSGNEALVFSTQQTFTSFIFKCGYNMSSNTSDWSSSNIGIPSIQIKNQSLYVNTAIANGSTPGYNFYVSGNSRLDGNLHIFPGSNSSWGEGIRIHAASNSWTTLVLCGTDNTGDSGTSANSWSLHAYGGNFYLSKNGSTGGTSYMDNISNKWYFNTTSGGEAVNVGGWINTVGACGWYNSTYGGGIWMNDSTYVRVYNGKYLYTTYQYYDVGNADYNIDHVYASNDRYIRPMAFSTFGNKLRDSGYLDGRYLRYEGWWTSGSGQNVDDAHGMIFAYSNHNLPGSWGIVTTFEERRGSDYRLQLYGDGYNSNFYFRVRSSDRGGWYGGWKRLLDSVNWATNTNSASGLLRSDGGIAWFNWSGQPGQPTWLWGGNSFNTYYVYNPSNFDVNSAAKLRITGYQSDGLSFYQTDSSFDGSPSSSWAHYIIANHGNGASYYHYTIRLPFWGPPQYRRQEGSTSNVTQWYTFLTTENGYWANQPLQTASSTATNPQFNSVNVGGTSTGYGAYLASGKRLYIEGTESNAIYTEHHANSHISTNSPESNAAIRHGFVFKWYDTYWKIGNVRGGSTNSAGFGIGYYAGSQLSLLVKPDLCGTNIYGKTANSDSNAALRVIKGWDCGNRAGYDTVVISSNDCTSLRLIEADGTCTGISAGDYKSILATTHNFQFYSGCSNTGTIYNGMGGTFRFGINYSNFDAWVQRGLRVNASGSTWTHDPSSSNSGVCIFADSQSMNTYIHMKPYNESYFWGLGTYYEGSGFGYNRNLLIYQSHISGTNEVNNCYIFRGIGYGGQGQSYVATCEGNSYNLVVIGVFTLTRNSPGNTTYSPSQVHGLIQPYIVNQVRNEWLGSHHTSDGGMIIRMDMRDGYQNYTTKTTINIVSAYGVITETWWGRKYVGLSREDVDAFCGSLGSFDIAIFASQPSQFTNNDYNYSQTNGVNTTGRYLMITNRTIAGWSSNGGIGRMSFAGLYGNRDGACITFKVTCFGYLS